MSPLLPAVLLTAFLSNPALSTTPYTGAVCPMDTQAHIVQQISPEFPEIARFLGLYGTSVVRIDLSETGTVLGTYVANSSGSSILDEAALHVVGRMTYASETRACESLPGSYAVEVQFAT
jgi:TonB family protein